MDKHQTIELENHLLLSARFYEVTFPFSDQTGEGSAVFVITETFLKDSLGIMPEAVQAKMPGSYIGAWEMSGGTWIQGMVRACGLMH